jgi:tetratricopeptide (TPR) repeat protein
VALLTQLAGGRTDWAPAAVGEIARACGGHPLALCLAGARLATRPEESLRSVADALAVPGRRIETLDEHAESDAAVTDVIGWSYHVLDQPVARVFRLLGVSPCPTLGLESVARLVDRDDDGVQPLIDGLVALHLVTAVGPGRYGMLDLIAEYAGTLAAQIDGAPEREAALDRLYGHHRAAARAAAGAMWPTEVRAAPAGYGFDNQQAALAWLDDHCDELTVAAGHADATSRPEHVVDLANSLFRYLDHGGHLDQAVALQEAAAAAAQRLGDTSAHVLGLGRLGAVLVRRGPSDRAEEVLMRARELSAQIGDVAGEAVALGNLGRLALRRGAYTDASAHQRAALELFRRCDDPLAQARTLTNLGIVHNACGEFDTAVAHLEEAQGICDRLEARDAAARVTGTLAASLRAQGRLDEADRHYREAIDAFHVLGDRVGEATCVSRLGMVRSDQGRHLEAIGLHEAAMKIFTEDGDEDGSIDTLLNLGTALRAVGEHVAAVSNHREALDRAGVVGSEGQAARAHASLAEDYAAQAAQSGVDAAGTLALACKHVDEALGRHHQLGLVPPPAILALAEKLRQALAWAGEASLDA